MKKVFFASSFLFIILNSLFVIPASVSAQVPGEWTNLITGKPADWCVKDGVATIQGFECIFVNVVRVLVPLVGIAFFIMLIAGAFQFITAGGEQKALQKARATLTSAFFGLIAFFGIWFILLLIKAITGVDVTQFMIPG